MDKKSKIFLAVLFLLIVASVGATYWRIFVKKDYVIENQIDCDPYVDACFIWECDPASTVEGEACTGDPEADVWYYEIARRSAANIPMCDPETDEDCDPWTCDEGEKDCSQTFCDETTKEEQGVECNDPEQYNIDNPVVEEDAVACEEGDESCLEVTDADLVDCDPATEECAPADADAAVDDSAAVAPTNATDATDAAQDQSAVSAQEITPVPAVTGATAN